MEIVKDKIFEKYPKAKDIDFSDDFYNNGIFFIELLVNDFTKCLVTFFREYETLLESKKENLSRIKMDKALSQALLTNLSIGEILDITDKESANYLDEICNVNGLTNDLFYKEGLISERIKHIANYQLATKDCLLPIVSYFKFINETKVYNSDTIINAIKIYNFEAITTIQLLYENIENRELFIQYWVETGIILSKVTRIMETTENKLIELW